MCFLKDMNGWDADEYSLSGTWKILRLLEQTVTLRIKTYSVFDDSVGSGAQIFAMT